MTRFSYRRRLGYLALSGASGWFAAQIGTLPNNLIIAVRNSEGEPRLFVQSIGLGLLVWAAWTLLLAFGATLVTALPLVMAVRPETLVRYRLRIVAVAVLASLAVTLFKLHGFDDRSASTFVMRYITVIPYGIFAVVFAIVTAWMYIALATRYLRQGDPAEAR